MKRARSISSMSAPLRRGGLFLTSRTSSSLPLRLSAANQMPVFATHSGVRVHFGLPLRRFTTAAPKSGVKPEPGPQVSLPTKENEVMVKKLSNLLRNKNPVTAKQYVSFLRKVADRSLRSLGLALTLRSRDMSIAREPTILSDKVISLLPQLTFEDERLRAKERAEQQVKEQRRNKSKKPAVKRKETTEEKERKSRELSIKEDEEERRKFTIVLASLGKMRKIEGMLYAYGLLKSRERQEEEQILADATEKKEKAVVDEPRWKVDVYMYNLVLDALSKAGYMNKVEEILQDMAASRVDKDRVTYSILYSAYSNRGNEGKADQMWQEMKDRGIEMDLAGYNGLMNNFARKNDLDRVLDAYKQMQAAGVKPDQGTFSILLECCAQDALEFRTQESTRNDKDEEEEEGKGEGEDEDEDEEGLQDQSLYEVDEKEKQRILQGKRRRMEAVMRAMKKADVKLDTILLNSVARCYASLGQIDEMFNVVRFLVEEENIKLVEDNYSLMVYCAGREKAIDGHLLRGLFEEMKSNNVQPTAKTINAVIHSFAFAGQDRLEEFILPPPHPEANRPETEKRNTKKGAAQRKEKMEKMGDEEQEETVSLWHLLKRYGVLVTDDILFDLLKLYATKEVAPTYVDNNSGEDGVGVDGGEAEAGGGSDARPGKHQRKLDRVRLGKLLRKMQEEGFGTSSLTVFNSLMRFHSIYGENRIREVTALYNQMKKRQVRPNLQTYLVMLDTVLSTERKIAVAQPLISERPQSQEEKERDRERAELSYLLFSEMQSEGIRPNLKLYNGLIELSGFEEWRRRSKDAGRHSAEGEEEFKQKVLSILGEMRRSGIRPNTKTLKSISSACVVAGAEKVGQVVFDELPRLFA